MSRVDEQRGTSQLLLAELLQWSLKSDFPAAVFADGYNGDDHHLSSGSLATVNNRLVQKGRHKRGKKTTRKTRKNKNVLLRKLNLF